MKKRISTPAAGIAVILLLFFGFTEKGNAATSSGDSKLAGSASYRYNPSGKTDPFQPFVERELLLLRKKKEQASVVSIYPLQRAGIDQFILVGIAGDVKRRIAIVELKEGKGRSYALALGTIIGLNNGKVVEINKDQVIIEETIQNRAGQKINKLIKRLHREEEGTP